MQQGERARRREEIEKSKVKSASDKACWRMLDRASQGLPESSGWAGFLPGYDADRGATSATCVSIESEALSSQRWPLPLAPLALASRVPLVVVRVGRAAPTAMCHLWLCGLAERRPQHRAGERVGARAGGRACVGRRRTTMGCGKTAARAGGARAGDACRIKRCRAHLYLDATSVRTSLPLPVSP